MGADFIYHILPRCELTPQRRIELIWKIEQIETKDELVNLIENPFWIDDDETDGLKQFLIDKIESYENLNYRRDVGWLYLNDRFYLLTGGMSWGDEPTDAFTEFEYLQWAWPELEKWAKEDEEKRGHDRKNGR